MRAELDIQYMMGITPGIKTEFYEQMNQSFCADLKAWTTLLLSTDDVPLVHSVSYGWQGNLTKIGCADADVTVIDTDFQKLDAKGNPQGPFFFDEHITYTDSTKVSVSRRERPWILFSESGAPRLLVTSMAGGRSDNQSGVWTMAQAVKGAK